MNEVVLIECTCGTVAINKNSISSISHDQDANKTLIMTSDRIRTYVDSVGGFESVFFHTRIPVNEVIAHFDFQ